VSNALAKETLAGKEYDQFERWGLEAKWMFLPKVLRCVGFDPGHHPFQGFAKLLKFRNELIHYKGIREQWVYGSVPAFLEKLGLTLIDSAASIAAVEAMIREFACQRGIECPNWLKRDIIEMNYFEILSGQRKGNHG
jgi:hypothetical protein